MTKVIVDPGSCHMGKLRYAKELISVAQDNGVDAVKFQLFKNLSPNIELPYRMFSLLKEYGDKLGIEVFASVWDKKGLEILKQCECKSIKFAYSMRTFWRYCIFDLRDFDNIYISGDVHTTFPDFAIKLYCIPEYPVLYQPAFEGLFPDKFRGFSDHTLGQYAATSAIINGAVCIEKHITLDKVDIHCPDHKFALKPKELEKMMKTIRNMDRGRE